MRDNAQMDVHIMQCERESVLEPRHVFKGDTTTVVFDQNHTLCHDNGQWKAGFPTTKKRQPKDKVLATQECLIQLQRLL